MKVSDVDLDAGKIFIEQGNGDKDRYILFPESFRLLLKVSMAANRRGISVRVPQQSRVQPAARATNCLGVRRRGQQRRADPSPVIPRHMLIRLTAQGLAIQLIGRHGSRTSLEVYQCLSL